MSDGPVYLLCLAIIKRAVKDYRAACCAHPGKSAALHRDELERFFRGAWFELMTGGIIDPETFMSMIRKGEIRMRFEDIE